MGRGQDQAKDCLWSIGAPSATR